MGILCLGTKNNVKKKDEVNKIAQEPFKNRKLLIPNYIKLKVRKWLLKTYVWSRTLFGCKTWRISKIGSKMLE